jgi:hypothetical protein
MGWSRKSLVYERLVLMFGHRSVDSLNEMYGGESFPLAEEGWLRHKQNVAKPH